MTATDYVVPIEKMLYDCYTTTDLLGLAWYSITPTTAEAILQDADELISMEGMWREPEHLLISIDEEGFISVEGLVSVLSSTISEDKPKELAISTQGFFLEADKT